MKLVRLLNNLLKPTTLMIYKKLNMTQLKNNNLIFSTNFRKEEILKIN